LFPQIITLLHSLKVVVLQRNKNCENHKDTLSYLSLLVDLKSKLAYIRNLISGRKDYEKPA
jgi:hypothetical protein